MKPFSLLFAALLMVTGSCKKIEIKNLEKAENRLKGAWNVDEIATQITDTLGNTLQDSSVFNQGSINFVAGDKSALGVDYFDRADFTGACALSDLVVYFSNLDAGSGFTNGWSLNWDADPEDLRVQFWAESRGGSYHISTNHTYNGGGQQIFYVIQPPSQNKRIFYTWKLSR